MSINFIKNISCYVPGHVEKKGGIQVEFGECIVMSTVSTALVMKYREMNHYAKSVWCSIELVSSIRL